MLQKLLIDEIKDNGVAGIDTTDIEEGARHIVKTRFVTGSSDINSAIEHVEDFVIEVANEED